MKPDETLSAYLFFVEIDGIETARFQKCIGLEAEMSVFEIEEGGYGIRTFPGRTRFPNIILEKGITENNELFKWYKETVLEGRKIERKNGSIVLKNLSGKEIKRWNCFRALPCRWAGPRLDANRRGEHAVERIEIAHEGLEVDNDLAEVSCGISTPIGKTWNDAQNVTSVWGERDSFQTSNGKRTLPGHNGMDFAAPEGTRINAIKAGTVTKVESNPADHRGYGKYVEITHEDGTHSLYGHQSKIIVQSGQKVLAGEKIGEVGATGNATGNHLHLGYDGDKDGLYSRNKAADNPARILYSDGY